MWYVATIGIHLAAVAMHSVICRLPFRGNSVVRFLIVGGVFGVGLIMLVIRLYGLSPEALAAVLVYAFLCELYLFLFTLAMSSVSATLLMTMAKAKLTQAEIDRLYDSERMVTQRLKRLVAAGFLRQTTDGLQLTPKGSRLVAAFDAMRRFFRHPSVGAAVPGQTRVA